MKQNEEGGKSMLKRFMSVILCMAIMCSGMMFPNQSAHADPEIGNVYYVDSFSGSDDNDGKSEENAWQTLDMPNATVFQPGDKILFKSGGIWNGQLRPLGSGAEGHPIIIDKYGSGDKPIINGNGTMGETVLKESGTVMLVDQEYWEINNLEVTNFSDTVISSRVGILTVSNSTYKNHIYIRNNYVHDVNSHWNGSKVTGGIIILGVGGFHDVLVENNHVKNVAIEGIRTANGSGRVNKDVVIRNNYIEEVLGDGIVLTSIAQGGLVENNVVKNFANTYVGSRNYAGIWSFVADNTVFQYNEAFGGKYGFNDGEGYDIDMNCYNSLFQYNYSHNNRGGFALFMGSSQKSVFRYNV
ncbi:MAG: putative cell wall binding repeat-containing protein, partial [Paenibacillus sp.]|nr:putative cell wall binding repeat-containing protein [Paenibacillus sp.]